MPAMATRTWSRKEDGHALDVVTFERRRWRASKNGLNAAALWEIEGRHEASIVVDNTVEVTASVSGGIERHRCLVAAKE